MTEADSVWCGWPWVLSPWDSSSSRPTPGANGTPARNADTARCTAPTPARLKTASMVWHTITNTSAAHSADIRNAVPTTSRWTTAEAAPEVSRRYSVLSAALAEAASEEVQEGAVSEEEASEEEALEANSDTGKNV